MMKMTAMIDGNGKDDGYIDTFMKSPDKSQALRVFVLVFSPDNNYL